VIEFDPPPIDVPAAKGKKGPTKSIVAGGQFVVAGATNAEMGAVAVGVRFQGGSAAERERTLEELFRQNFEVGGTVKGQERQRREVNWLGHKARELVMHFPESATTPPQELVIRMVIVGSNGYIGGVFGRTRPWPEFENGFFENFEILK
jgi:hypothetical protein